MARTKDKSEVVKGLQEKFAKTALAVITDYKGISVTEMSELRKRLYKINADYKIAKNTLVKIAAKDTPFKELESILEGSNAILFGYGDPAESTKTLVEYFKEIEKGELKGGFYDGKLLTQKELKTLATLPPKEVLLGQIAGLLVANTAGIAGCLESLIRDIALLSEEVAKKNAAGKPVAEKPATEQPTAAVEEPKAEQPAPEPPAPEQPAS